MATASVMISDALKEICVLGEDSNPSDMMLADGLRMLNRLLDTFSNNPTWAYDQSASFKVLTGVQSFTIGPSGDLIESRPIMINSASYTIDGITYPVSVIDYEKYDSITCKTLTGAYPSAIYYQGTYPNGTVFIYPIATGGTLSLRLTASVKQFANAATEVDMPEGYEDAIMLALAIRMAPSYGKQVSQDTRIAARRAKKLVEANNLIVPTLSLPSAIQGGGTSYAQFMSGY